MPEIEKRKKRVHVKKIDFENWIWYFKIKIFYKKYCLELMFVENGANVECSPAVLPQLRCLLKYLIDFTEKKWQIQELCRLLDLTSEILRFSEKTISIQKKHFHQKFSFSKTSISWKLDPVIAKALGFVIFSVEFIK